MKCKSTGGAHNQSYRTSHAAAIPKVGPLVSSKSNRRSVVLDLSNFQHDGAFCF